MTTWFHSLPLHGCGMVRAVGSDPVVDPQGPGWLKSSISANQIDSRSCWEGVIWWPPSSSSCRAPAWGPGEEGEWAQPTLAAGGSTTRGRGVLQHPLRGFVQPCPSSCSAGDPAPARGSFGVPSEPRTPAIPAGGRERVPRFPCTCVCVSRAHACLEPLCPPPPSLRLHTKLPCTHGPTQGHEMKPLALREEGGETLPGRGSQQLPVFVPAACAGAAFLRTFHHFLLCRGTRKRGKETSLGRLQGSRARQGTGASAQPRRAWNGNAGTVPLQLGLPQFGVGGAWSSCGDGLQMCGEWEEVFVPISLLYGDRARLWGWGDPKSSLEGCRVSAAVCGSSPLPAAIAWPWAGRREPAGYSRRSLSPARAATALATAPAWRWHVVALSLCFTVVPPPVTAVSLPQDGVPRGWSP